MSFEFLGSFNQSQLQRFSAFARAQLTLVDDRISHLSAEIERVGALSFAYDAAGIPTGYVPNPPNSYIGKLAACYEVLGGDAFLDLNIRSSTQPVFIIKASETTSPQLLSNGEIMGAAGLADAPSATLMQQARAGVEDILDYRRDYVERKIRRAVDYSEQLQKEINLLLSVKLDVDVTNSLENLLAGLQELVDDHAYRAVTKGTDPLNKQGAAPFSSFEPGPNEGAASYEKTLNGNVVPGEVGPGPNSGTA